MRVLTIGERFALRSVAGTLKVEPVTLAALIEFESGWNPKIKNKGSSARGLIQFMDSTASSMGFEGGSAQLISSYPTAEKQLLGPVKWYLAPFAPFTQAEGMLPGQSLFMSVFYPAARHWLPDEEFPPTVKRYNPGIVTVRDYVEHVWRRAGDINPSEVEAQEV